VKEELIGTMGLFYSSNSSRFSQLYFHSHQSSDDSKNNSECSSVIDPLTEPEQFYSRLTCLSHPYDPLLLFAWKNLQLFQPQLTANHVLIGMDEANPGLAPEQAHVVRQELARILRYEIARIQV
jgi:hypothetical protein